ncbi:MAG: hypothetical protein GY733_06325, partial [bacterium]|nr:hypothetical protein [bacterium]
MTFSRDASVAGTAAQSGLFVLWDVARVQEQRILADLGSRFELLQVHEVHWSPDLVATNFQRFYSDLDVRG